MTRDDKSDDLRCDPIHIEVVGSFRRALLGGLSNGTLPP